MSNEHYRHWRVVSELPEGWAVDLTVGSPMARSVFITNGKSILSGEQERAILKVATVKQEPTKVKAEAERKVNPPKVKIDENYRMTVNDLARKKFTEKLLQDIMVDFMVCDIEGWDKRQYIAELQDVIGSIEI